MADNGIPTPAVLITGASTGIGASCALALDRKGWTVFAGVRRVEDGERLRERASDRLRPVIVDVTDASTIATASEQIAAAVEGRGLQGLVNNAGVAIAGPLEFLPIEDLREQIEINVVGQIAVTQCVLPLLRRGGGRIINMSSISGKVASPFLAPYAASKFALEALSDGLRVELEPWNIHVAVIEPGSIKTPIWERGIGRADRMRSKLPTEAETLYGEAFDTMRERARQVGEAGIARGHVARAVYHALTSRRPRTRYIVGRDAQVQSILSTVLPDRAMDALKRRTLGLSGRGKTTER
jgi:NAD(P)-dependent dehydrogenase (short-subunit alcohol dehydrogenase family)